MLKAGIVPSILPEEPPAPVNIRYAEEGNVDFGTEFKPGKLIDPPVMVDWPSKCCSLYTLSMIDPDSKPVETNHWLVVNIPGNQLGKGDVVAPYTGPKPPAGSGIHRYVFTVYKQLERIQKLPLINTQETRHASTLCEFVTTHKLGKPIAGNFLTAQADEYSINFWKNLGKNH